MTTKKNEEPEVKDTKSSIADYCHIEFLDNNDAQYKTTTTTTDIGEKEDVMYHWAYTPDEKKKEVAVDITMKLIDFNLKQLARTDVDSVRVFSDPAEYAAEMVNELFEKIERE